MSSAAVSRWRRRLLPALLLLGLVGAACRPVSPVVKIGFVAPFEGRERALGYDAIYSARLAIREVNGAGGLHGARLALVALDDGGAPDQAAAAARALTTDHDVVIAIGHWGAATTDAAAPIYAAAGLPFIATSAGGQFSPIDPARLPVAFLNAYAAVTPFDETAGPIAGPAYDALQLALAAIDHAATTGAIDRPAVAAALSGLVTEGLLGPVTLPAAAAGELR